MTKRWPGMAALLASGLVAGCGSSHVEAAPSDHAPSIELAPIEPGALCVTKGRVEAGAIDEPTMRGYARGAGGDAAQLTFKYRGESFETRALAGGQERRQVGLKLRARDGCNLVYVMWRLDPRPMLDVSVKVNPTMRTHEACGAEGYTKVKPYRKNAVAAFSSGDAHTLRAEIVGDELLAWIDGKLLWQGRLPPSARSLSGPAGVRTDNVRVDLVELAATRGGDNEPPACKREGGD